MEPCHPEGDNLWKFAMIASHSVHGSLQRNDGMLTICYFGSICKREQHFISGILQPEGRSLKLEVWSLKPVSFSREMICPWSGRFAEVCDEFVLHINRRAKSKTCMLQTRFVEISSPVFTYHANRTTPREQKDAERTKGPSIPHTRVQLTCTCVHADQLWHLHFPQQTTGNY